MGRCHSHRPGPLKVAQRKRQAAYAATYQAKKRQEREHARAEREAAEQAAYARPAVAPTAPPVEQEPATAPVEQVEPAGQTYPCSNCQQQRPADQFPPSAPARIAAGTAVWCRRCRTLKQNLIRLRAPEEVRSARVRHLGSRGA